MITPVKTGQSVEMGWRDLRFKPDQGLLDPQTGQSQFGRNRDDWGNWFGCNADNFAWFSATADHYIRRNPHVAPPPGRVHVTPDRIVYPVGRVISHCDLNHRPNVTWGQPGRLTSAAGVTIYRDELFGPHFTGNLFGNDSVFDVVYRKILTPAGTVFRGDRSADEQQSEFLATHDIWSRFSTQETGPDGALWVLDLYRFVIEHPEWINDELEKTLDLRAGHDKGRIYRIYPVDRKPRPIPRLDGLDTAGLIAALDSSNGWQRDMAHQMLLWRADRAAIEPLAEMAVGCKRALARLHALWVLDGLGATRPETVIRALADEHPGVRRHAVRLSEPLLASHPALGEALLKLEDDADPQIQMQLAYTLGEWDDPRAGSLPGRMAVRHSGDRFLTAAVMSSATDHLGAMIAELLSDRTNLAARASLIGNLSSMAVATKDQRAIAGILGAVTTNPKAGYSRWQFDLMAQLLDELDRQDTTLTRFCAAAGPALGRSLQQVPKLFGAARSLATDEGAALVDRTASFRILARGLAQEEDLQLLVELLVPQTPVEVQLAVVESMGHLRRAGVPQRLLSGWSGQVPQDPSAA